MSPQRPSALTKRERLRSRAIAVIGLVLVWNLLWGAFTWLNTITGAVIAVALLVVFPLPPVKFGGRLRPVAVVKFFARFFFDLTVASFQVAFLAFRRGEPRSAIVAVELRVKSDLNMTLVAEAVSLVPGSLIAEADHQTGTLYIHMLGVRDAAHLERLRAEVLQLEARLVRAIGSDAELRLVEAPVPTDREERPA
ncbi:Na+/H+ antiporter subunit E [Glycomyces artemisiae]|uniref:Multisubunit sodium/proton antiporter MrpE subunit n=1 Tax=Glycomyces artemisiae TaxID=1076443 RepID=A0A2T0UDE2_9ACTN|nr:Na+/H+ antiporter subunit E [Glycomyces artemisiae]PRY55965.1 multisubunit sodium/proton antiporter MrpE subunit [Glycomyces artemisiae]